METDQVKMIFAMKWAKCAGRITVYTGLTGRFFVFSLRALGRASMRGAWERSVFFERCQVSWISQHRVVESARLFRIVRGDSDKEHDKRRAVLI